MRAAFVAGRQMKPAAVAVAALLAASCANRGPAGYSGTVQAESAAVGSTIGGRVAAVLVQDGDIVKAGRLLVELDGASEEASYRAALAQARATRAALADLLAGARKPDLARAQALARQAQANYEGLKNSAEGQLAALDDRVRESEANVASFRAAVHDAQTDGARQDRLFATGDVSQQTRDAAGTRLARASADLAAAIAAASDARNERDAGYETIRRNEAAAQQALRAAQESYRSLAVGPRPDAVTQARADIAAADATARSAEARLDQMTVRAPAPGQITALNLHRGDIVSPNAAVATIDEFAEPYVRVYVPQSELGTWHVGAAVEIHSDASPTETTKGTIEAVDSRAQFTPQSVQTAEDRANLTFGVKVRIHARGGTIHGGTTATVTIS
jgi:HlyD family secretion protein